MDEEDKELEELLRKKKETLLKSLKTSERKAANKLSDMVDIVRSYLSDDAWDYLRRKLSSDEESFNLVLRAIFFLISNGLVEKGLSVESVAFISKRVLGEESKIFIQEDEEFREI